MDKVGFGLNIRPVLKNQKILDYTITKIVKINSSKCEKIEVSVCVLVVVDLKLGYSEERFNEGVHELITQILMDYTIENKIALIIANLTGSFGEGPLILQDQSFVTQAK